MTQQVFMSLKSKQSTNQICLLVKLNIDLNFNYFSIRLLFYNF